MYILFTERQGNKKIIVTFNTNIDVTIMMIGGFLDKASVKGVDYNLFIKSDTHIAKIALKNHCHYYLLKTPNVSGFSDDELQNAVNIAYTVDVNSIRANAKNKRYVFSMRFEDGIIKSVLITHRKNNDKIHQNFYTKYNSKIVKLSDFLVSHYKLVQEDYGNGVVYNYGISINLI